MEDTIFIQRKFKLSKDGISLSDALVYLKDEYDALTPQQIEDLKQERLDKHIERIKNPPVIPQPTKAELLAALESERKDLEARWSQVEGKEITISQTVKSQIGGSK